MAAEDANILTRRRSTSAQTVMGLFACLWPFRVSIVFYRLGQVMGPMDPERLLEVLGNKYSTEILKATTEPRTAQELSEELDIPIATCYRRLEDLSAQGILKQSGKRVTRANRVAKRYQRQIDRICFDVDDTISITLKEPPGTASKLDEAWQRHRR